MIGFAQAFQALDGSRLTGPIGADHAEDFSPVDLEREFIHGHELTVGFLKLVYFNNLLHNIAPGAFNFHRRLLRSLSALRRAV